MTARTRTSRGFTLMEMLAALIMTAIVSAPLYIITRDMGEQTEYRRAETEAQQRARTGMNLLARDFSRAGLFTSPNTGKDPRFLNRQIPSDAQYRAAVVHLNRNAAGMDAVMLSGNFVDSDKHKAIYMGSSMFYVYDMDEVMCKDIFNKDYTFVHVIGPRDLWMDIRVTDVQAPCTLTVEQEPSAMGLVAQGEEADLAANQTAVYRVEDGQLVRYFVAYDSPVGTTGVCSMANINGATVTTSRRVLADNVMDFQVWFRPKRRVSDGVNNWNEPYYKTLSNVPFTDGMLPPDSWQVYTYDLVNPPGDNDVGCDFSLNEPPSFIGPEQVRSAVIRLTVRSHTEDFNIRPPEAGDGRLIHRNLAPGPNGGSYKLATLVTEIEMPNMAARSDL